MAYTVNPELRKLYAQQRIDNNISNAEIQTNSLKQSAPKDKSGFVKGVETFADVIGNVLVGSFKGHRGYL